MACVNKLAQTLLRKVKVMHLPSRCGVRRPEDLRSLLKQSMQIRVAEAGDQITQLVELARYQMAKFGTRRGDFGLFDSQLLQSKKYQEVG